jgi:hypothetical protein
VRQSAAFVAAERKRRRHLPTSRPQRDTVVRLARELGIEPPSVYSLAEASDAITRLKAMKRQPVLAGFSASTSALTKGEK